MLSNSKLQKCINGSACVIATGIQFCDSPYCSKNFIVAPLDDDDDDDDVHEKMAYQS